MEDRQLTLSLAERFIGGEAAAAAEIRDHVALVIAHRGYRIPRSDREDLVQEVMIQLWKAVHRPDFDSRKDLWGFVEVVVARRCIDWMRKSKESSPLEPTLRDQAPSAQHELLTRERAGLATQALSQLGPQCRELIYLHAVLNRSYREIAGFLGKMEGALRVQMYRCLQRTRRILAGLKGGAAAGADGGDRRRLGDLG